jgi:lysophospholipase L1-like esterase
MTENVTWHEARTLGVQGKGWTDTKRFYDRLPARAEEMVPAGVWELSRQSAGMCIGFKTAATTIAVRWTLLLDQLIRPMMSPLGASGLDLYVRDTNGKWRWGACGQPEGKENQKLMLKNLSQDHREYLLYLPLRNGIEHLEIGVETGSAVQPITPFPGRPIVYYGTSIVHGEGASRAGMCHAAILGRRLNRPMINLGFAGAGMMDIGIAELMSELGADLYLVDCLPNMFAPMIAERTEPFVRKIREVRPKTPILLVEDRTGGNAWLYPAGNGRHTLSRAALRAAYQRLMDTGITNLHYMPGDGLLGRDDEATCDSSHPNDLGYFRMADALQPVIESILKESK